jgi:hypothetical protein
VQAQLSGVGFWVGLVVDELVLQGLGEEIGGDVVGGVAAGVQVVELVDQVADPPLAGQTYRERPAAGAAAFAVPGLVGRLGDHGGDAASSQMPSDRS